MEVKKIGKTSIIQEWVKVDISNSLEVYHDYAKRGYMLLGDKLSALRPYAEITRHDFLY